MPNPVWPLTLPQSQFLGLTDQRQDAVLRTQMDAGPPSRRARFTAATRDVNVPLVLKGAQKGVFDDFFIDDLVEGSLAFEWTDPVNDNVVLFAFASPPTWALTKGGSQRIWRTTLALQIQPSAGR